MTATPWHSLYLRCEDTTRTAQTVRDLLTELDFTLYDPTDPTVPAYTRTVRVFVAPPAAGWTRLLTEGGEQLAQGLSHLGLCLSLTLDGDKGRVQVFADGAEIDAHIGLTPYLRTSPDALKRAFEDDYHAQQQGNEAPFDLLPDDLRAQAENFNQKTMNRMFGRFMRQINRQIGGGNADAARDLLRGSVDWQSAGGQRLCAVMTCLDVPEDWRTPDFVTLRDAYQLHHRRQRSPNAPEYPGDAEAMAAVPDALAYIPVYGGRS